MPQLVFQNLRTLTLTFGIFFQEGLGESLDLGGMIYQQGHSSLTQELTSSSFQRWNSLMKKELFLLRGLFLFLVSLKTV